MIPILLNLGPIKIYTFGVFLVLAFFWGSFLLWKLIRMTSFKEEDIFDGLFLSLGGGLFFARIFYVILNFKEFGFDFLKFILINGYPGLSLYGALFGGFFTLFFYCLIKKINFGEVVDYYIPPLLLSLAVGKLGSFFSGEEVGKKTKFFLAVKYVSFEGSRHLTSFYEALLFFLASYIAYKLVFEIRKEKYRPSFNFYFFFWYFAFTYFIFDKIKETNLYLGRGSFNGVISLILFLTISLYFLYYFKVAILILKYVKQTYQKIYWAAKRKAGKRIKKNP